jgi:hypothetical protein
MVPTYYIVSSQKFVTGLGVWPSGGTLAWHAQAEV